MEQLFDYNTFLLFLGGIFSLILTVIIIIAKQEYKRHLERERLTAAKQKDPEAVGDIEAKLNDSYEFRRFNFFELLTQWGLQPLFIISFINLFYSPSTIEIIIAFALTVFVILHEFWSGVQFSNKRPYQILIHVLWLGLFLLFSYRANTMTTDRDKNQQTQTQQTIDEEKEEKNHAQQGL